jgi:hypothetical protein
MMTLDELAQVARAQKLRMPVSSDALARTVATSALTLFYEPIIALSTLLMAHQQKGDLRTPEVSVWAAATLANCYFAYQTRHRLSLEWSALFRERCANALTILETVQFIAVEESDERRIVVTELGKKKIRDLLASAGDAGLLARRLRRSATDAFRLGLGLL